MRKKTFGVLMSSLFVTGGKRLSGEIYVSGSKNAALPLLFSTIAINGVSTLSGVPDIGDVRVALLILEEFGASVSRFGSTLVIDTRNLKYCKPSVELVGKIRASTYLLGSMLARFSRAEIYNFGGCNFCARPIDMHLYALQSLGARLEGDTLVAEKLRGADIFFEKASVGATINALILASAADGVSRIFGYAREPHVLSLVSFLRSAGIKISLCDEYLEIEGGKPVSGTIAVIPDMIEAGTYIILSLITDSELLIRGADVGHLTSLLTTLAHAGANFKIDDEGILPFGKIKSPIKIETAPHPGFPTDLQPQMAPLLAVFSGGEITESVWQKRFGYLRELEKLGVAYEICDDTAKIMKSKLRCGVSTAPDLRGGAALLIAALYASGQSEIKNAEILFRGYENLEEKLSSIGAMVERK